MIAVCTQLRLTFIQNPHKVFFVTSDYTKKCSVSFAVALYCLYWKSSNYLLDGFDRKHTGKLGNVLIYKPNCSLILVFLHSLLFYIVTVLLCICTRMNSHLTQANK